MTVVAVLLVDRKGRKFLLMLGTGGIVVSLLAAGLLFRGAEAHLADVRPAIAAQVQNDGLAVRLDAATLAALGAAADGTPQQLTIAYAYGPFTNVKSLRSDDPVLRQVSIAREDAVQADSVIGVFFRKLHLNPFADPAAGREAPLRIEKASLGPVPPSTHGWLVAIAICVFVSSFAVGPGVCVWLALSELMPTRIRSNGMSIALLVNQFVSTVIAAIFLPTVGLHGYSTLFFFGAGCTVLYFLAAAFLLPETKGQDPGRDRSAFFPVTNCSSLLSSSGPPSGAVFFCLLDKFTGRARTAPYGFPSGITGAWARIWLRRATHEAAMAP